VPLNDLGGWLGTMTTRSVACVREAVGRDGSAEFKVGMDAGGRTSKRCHIARKKGMGPDRRTDDRCNQGGKVGEAIEQGRHVAETSKWWIGRACQ